MRAKPDHGRTQAEEDRGDDAREQGPAEEHESKDEADGLNEHAVDDQGFAADAVGEVAGDAVRGVGTDCGDAPPPTVPPAPRSRRGNDLADDCPRPGRQHHRRLRRSCRPEAVHGNHGETVCAVARSRDLLTRRDGVARIGRYES